VKSEEKVQKRCRCIMRRNAKVVGGGAEVQRCSGADFEVLKSCRGGAEVQRCRAGADGQRCRGGADGQRYNGTEVQRC